MKKPPAKKPLFATIKDKVSEILSGTNGRIIVNPSLSHDTLFDKDYELYIEHYFNQRLCFERKRTERSRNPFLMMLLNIEELEVNKSKIIRDVISALLTSTRETDIKGWYRHNSIIGVIFTEISNLDMDSIEQKILGKLYETVESSEEVEKKDKLILKRIIDIGGCFAGFLIFSPFFIIVPIIIKLTSEGPILFNQERIGLNGEKFFMYKF